MNTTILSVINGKGGVTKTQTCIEMATALSRDGNRVLVLDLDPNAHLTKFFSPEALFKAINGQIKTMTDVLKADELRDEDKAEEAEQITEEAIMHISSRENGGCIDLIPTCKNLSKVEGMINTRMAGRETVLDRQLSKVLNRYDYLVIDNAATPGLLTINGFSISGKMTNVLIPIESGNNDSVDGVASIIEYVKIAKRYYNPNIRIIGAVLMRYKNTNKDKETRELAMELCPMAGVPVFEHYSRERAEVSALRNHKQSVIGTYDDKSKKSDAYEDFEGIYQEYLTKSGGISNG